MKKKLKKRPAKHLNRKKGGINKKGKALSLKTVEEYIARKQYDKAKTVCKKILALAPDNIDALSLAGTIALLQKNHTRAVHFLQKALALAPENPALHCNLGVAQKALGNFLSAAACFEKALTVDPGCFEALTNISALKLQNFQYGDALGFLCRANRVRPADCGVLLLLAQVSSKHGQLKKSIDYYEKYLKTCLQRTGTLKAGKTGFADTPFSGVRSRALQDQGIEVKAKLADLYERTNQKKTARKSALDIIRCDPGHLMANLVIAKLDRQRDCLDKAADRLEQYTDINRDSDILAEIMTERGFVLDRLGRFDDAFASFSRANDIMARSELAGRINRAFLPDLISRNITFFQSKEAAYWPTDEPNDKLPSPVFLVGFPRSGTTLLEQIIAARTGIATSDELPILDDISRTLPQLLGKEIQTPNELGSLSEKDVKKLRAIYWQKVAEYLGTAEPCRLFLDKQPLNLLHLGFIRRVFPSSKIIMALRDPRDVCLSNFFQMFGLNEAMIHFLKLQTTVDFYVQVMRLWLVYRERFAGLFFECRYEELVIDPEATINRLLSFVCGSAGGHIKMPDHTTLAAQRSVSTPSYHDVTQPIYSRASGRWLHYKKQLAPHLETLQSAIKALSYAT